MCVSHRVIDCRARALLRGNRALLRGNRALLRNTEPCVFHVVWLTVARAHCLSENRALWCENRALLCENRALLRNMGNIMWLAVARARSLSLCVFPLLLSLMCLLPRPIFTSGIVAVCCSVLQCVAVCCSALQCVAVCCIVLRFDAIWVCCRVLWRVCCNMLLCVVVSVVQCVVVRSIEWMVSLSVFLLLLPLLHLLHLLHLPIFCTLQHVETHPSQHIATPCNTLQRTATHCNTLQDHWHTAKLPASVAHANAYVLILALAQHSHRTLSTHTPPMISTTCSTKKWALHSRQSIMRPIFP